MTDSDFSGRSSIFNQLQAGIERFPAPALLAFIAAIIVAHGLIGDGDEPHILFAAFAVFFWGMAAALLAEGRWRPAAARLVPLLPAALIAQWIATRPTGELAAATGVPLIVAGMAAVIFALTRPRRLDRANGWGALREDVLAALIALAVAFAACVGLTAALGLISLLIDDLSEDLISLTWSFGMIFGAPVIWFARMRTPVAPPEAPGAFYRGVALWLLGPLTVVYLVTLHGLALKLFPDLQLPDGATGWVVAPFLAVAAVTLHALSGLPHSPLLGRILFWSPAATLAPAAVMLIAAGERIDAYGLTEPRIFLALLGLWALAMALGGYLWRPLHGVRAQAGVLAAGLTLAAFAATPLAIGSQQRVFDAITEGGQANEQRIRDVAGFLEDRAALDVEGTRRAETAAALAGKRDQARRPFCGVKNRRTASIAIGDFSRRLFLEPYPNIGDGARVVADGAVTFTRIGEDRLRFTTGDGVTGAFDLARFMAAATDDCMKGEPRWPDIDDAARWIDSEDGQAALLIEDFEARRDDPAGPWRLNRIGGELFLK